MKLETVESVRQFDERLRGIVGGDPFHVNLEKTWKACQGHPS